MCISDSRDIGSVVFPNADFKFFLTADLDVRSVRRKNELKKIGEDLSIDDLKNGIDELAKASQSFAEKLYAEAQNDTANPSSNESDDVVEGEVIEDE